MSKLEDDELYKLGRFFGFPDCCIEDFRTTRENTEVRKLRGTGYIPCPDCNEKSEE